MRVATGVDPMCDISDCNVNVIRCYPLRKIKIAVEITRNYHGLFEIFASVSCAERPK